MNNSIRTSNSPREGSWAWRPFTWLSTALLACALATPLLAESQQDEDKKGEEHRHSHIVRPDSRPFGHTYGEWATKWWQWALSIPADGHHPLQDETGADAARGQSGPVWFLGGVINVSGTAVRHVTVPTDKALFFPVMNVECSTVEPPPFYGANEADLRACAESFINVDLACTIDGRPVEDLADFESTSPLFNFSLPANNILGVAGGGPGQAVDHGTYVMVKGLSQGEHTIHFSGSSADGGFKLNITYHLTVVRPAKVFPPKSHPYGKSYSAWGAEWWKWAYSFPAGEDKNPVEDPTGALGGLGQSGPVWFLAGSFAKTVTRELTVPTGKALFFPIINSVWFNLPDYGDAPWSPEQHVFALSVIAPFVDNAFNLSCQVDGAPVENLANYRPQTPLGKDYEITMPEGNLTGFLPAGTYGPCVDDGIWLMLKPLKEGKHTVRFTSASKGSYAGDVALDVTYHLTVAPKKH